MNVSGYSVKYLFEFESLNGTHYRIRIHKKGYNGSVIQRAMGRAPMLRRESGDSGIYGTSLEIYAECSVDGEFAELYTSDAKEFYVTLSRVVNSADVNIWQGFVSPELYAEPSIAPPYDVQIIATDGLGETKMTGWTSRGRQPLYATLKYILELSGLNIGNNDIYIINSLRSVTPNISAANLLTGTYADMDYMVGQSCYDVLSQILQSLHMRLFQQGCAWWLIRETDINVTNGYISYYNAYSGVAGTIAVTEIGSIASDYAWWPVGYLSQKVVAAKNEVTAAYAYRPKPSMLADHKCIDLSRWSSRWAFITPQVYNVPNIVVEGRPDDSGYGYLSQQVNVESSQNNARLTIDIAVIGSAVHLSGIDHKLYLQIQSSGVTWSLGRASDGSFFWVQSAIQGIKIGELVNYYERSGDLRITDSDFRQVVLEIPGFPISGTMTFRIENKTTLTYIILGGQYLTISSNYGYKDILLIDNDARQGLNDIEISIGDADDIPNVDKSLYNYLSTASVLTSSWRTDRLTSPESFLRVIAKDYALSHALPRLSTSGTINVPYNGSISIVAKNESGINHIVETWDWNLLDDELSVEATSLPAIAISVVSEETKLLTAEEIREIASGTQGYYPSSGSGKITEQYWEIADIGTEEEPQSIIEADYPIAIPDGEIYAYIEGESRQYKKLFSIVDDGTEEEPAYTLVSELPLGIRKDDEIVILTDIAEKINFINVGTVEDPVWVVDMSPVIIKNTYPEGEVAPDPSDSNWYSALKANSTFVRKDVDDQVNGIITFNNNVKFGSYTAGSSGASVYKDSDNAWHIEADYLHVRRALNAEEVQIQRVSHIGGKVMNTPASMVCSSVTDMGTYYRCHFQQKDGEGREIFNQFVVGDQAYCETFNLEKQEGGTLGNHYYWRLVVGVGDNYIDLSKSDCASSSQAPKAGDNIVQMGNRNTESRQSAIIEASAGSGSPFIRVYKGISGYSLPTPRIDINPTLSVFYGQFYNASGTDIETLISSAKTLAQGAQTAASSAVTAANNAVSAAATAYNIASSAYDRSSSAISTANSAATTANSAASSAASAITAANNAQNTANAASSAASSAQSTADDALEATGTNAAAISTLNGQVTAIAGRFNSQGHLTELSSYMLTATYATMLTANFNSDGSVKSSSSIVTTSTYAALMSQYLTDHNYINSTAGLVVTSGSGGNAFANMFASSVTSQGIAKTASIEAYVDNKIATLSLSADQINFTGKTIINGHFIVDNSGNLEIHGGIKATNTVTTVSGVNYVFDAVGNSRIIGNIYAVDTTGSHTLQAPAVNITATGANGLILNGTSKINIVSPLINLEGKLSLHAYNITSGSSFYLSSNSNYQYFLCTQSSALTFYLGTGSSGQIIFVKQCNSTVTLNGTIRRGSTVVTTYAVGDGKTAVLVYVGNQWSLTLSASN